MSFKKYALNRYSVQPLVVFKHSLAETDLFFMTIHFTSSDQLLFLWICRLIKVDI